MVLSSPSVVKLIANQADSKKAESIFTVLSADMKPSVLKTFVWFLRKLWRNVYDKVVVDDKTLRKIAKLRKKTEGPIIYMPTHRSYIDFLILSYILISYNIDAPYVASRDDFLGLSLVSYMMRNSGAFFIRKNMRNCELTKAIFSEYVKLLCRDGQSIEFFIEGTRSRTGKCLHPKVGML